jgi:hypothetical protein
VANRKARLQLNENLIVTARCPRDLESECQARTGQIAVGDTEPTRRHDPDLCTLLTVRQHRAKQPRLALADRRR